MYDLSTRTLNAIFASKLVTSETLQLWLGKAPELVCHPSILILVICEHILNKEVKRRMELHSHDMDTDAILLGMAPNRPDVSHM